VKRSAYVDSWIEAGREEGIKAGTVAALRQSLVRWGSRRLGVPGPQILARLQRCEDTELLSRWGDRMMEVETWEELLREA